MLESSLKQVRLLVQSPAPGQPDEVTRALSRFLVIRSCGYLEQVTEECCKAYIENKASPAAYNFASSWLGGGTNPAPERLIKLVRRFHHEWGEELYAFFEADDQRLRRSISFLVGRRNKIAHGESEGVGARRSLDLADEAMEVADWFILRLDPTR